MLETPEDSAQSTNHETRLHPEPPHATISGEGASRGANLAGRWHNPNQYAEGANGRTASGNRRALGGEAEIRRISNRNSGDPTQKVL